MRPILAALFVLFAATAPVPAPAETKSATNPPPAGSQPFESEAAAVAAVKGWVERLGFAAESSTSGSLPVLSLTAPMTNATHHVRMVIDAKRDMIYIFINRYLTVPTTNPNCGAVLRELMKKNWDFNIGKFEWDPSDGEVRYSYCFTTENGIGFEAFRAIVSTLLATGDKYWPELKKVADAGKPSGGK